jgi:hypothetical protein
MAWQDLGIGALEFLALLIEKDMPKETLSAAEINADFDKVMSEIKQRPF